MEEPVNRRVLPHRRPAVPWNLDHGAINVLWAKEAIARHRRRALRRLRRDALVALRLLPRAAEAVDPLDPNVTGRRLSARARCLVWVRADCGCTHLATHPTPCARTPCGRAVFF